MGSIETTRTMYETKTLLCERCGVDVEVLVTNIFGDEYEGMGYADEKHVEECFADLSEPGAYDEDLERGDR